MKKEYALITQPLEYDEEEYKILNDKPYRYLALIVLFLFVSVFVVWGSLAPLSSAVHASGQVSVTGNKKIIQHYEGGIVENILVQDGQKVKANQVLIQLEKTKFQSELEITRVQLLESLAKEARLIAERDDMQEIVFPQELLNESNTVKQRMMSAQQGEFRARKKLLEDDETISEQRIEQMQNQIDGIIAIIKSKQDLLVSYTEEINEWENLYEQQLTDKIHMRDIIREKVRSEGEVANFQAEIAKIEVQMSEIESEMILKRQDFLRGVLSELSDTQRKIIELEAHQVFLKDALERTEIRSPVDGTVVDLRVHTIGAVIGSGLQLMDIVPENERLIIDAKVATHEVNYIHEGMDAEVRFAGFAHIRSLKMVRGEVYEVSADALVEQTSRVPYYGVKIKILPEGEQELARNHLTIKPGMPADAMIITGSRTLLEYLIQPFENLFIRGFREQ